MRTQIVEGSPQQIAEHIQRMGDSVLRALLFMDDSAPQEPLPPDEDFFAGTEPYMSHAPVTVDYSREAIYTAREGE